MYQIQSIKQRRNGRVNAPYRVCWGEGTESSYTLIRGQLIRQPGSISTPATVMQMDGHQMW
jgi:hypothetical protein